MMKTDSIHNTWLKNLVYIVVLIAGFQFCKDVMECIPLQSIGLILNMWYKVALSYVKIVTCFAPFLLAITYVFNGRNQSFSYSCAEPQLSHLTRSAFSHSAMVWLQPNGYKWLWLSLKCLAFSSAMAIQPTIQTNICLPLCSEKSVCRFLQGRWKEITSFLKSVYRQMHRIR